MTPLSDDALRALAAGGTALSYVALCAGTWRAHRAREARVARAAAALAPAAEGAQPVLVAHASQTGNAEQIAWQTTQALHTAGVPARIASLSQLRADELAAAERALFIVSTYGEGDPPDAAAPFVRRVMAQAAETPLALDGLHCAVLALGDREYQHYCGFGRTLEAWLHRQGAQPMFERIDVDAGDAAALQQWQHEVARLAGTADLPDWQIAAPFEPWRLAHRRLLNPGSVGGPCFHLEFEAPAGAAAMRPDWQAGDLVQVLPPGDGERPREYSIASLPSDGRVHLLVRQERHADGTPGLASGWLTERAAVGDEIALRLRAHGNFRLGDNAGRPLILIGNGTGLAGLRAHLKARAAARQGANWLVFGERHAAHDAYYRDEIAAWQTGGMLERADLVFSRDQPGKRYVQDCLREQADTLRDWVARGAALYVCGSLVGMASGVEAALVDVLGRDGVDRLIETGRLRRDVY